jgi:hypothetical protein
MKKFISALVATAMIALTLAGCGGSFDAKGDITVISREEARARAALSSNCSA